MGKYNLITRFFVVTNVQIECLLIGRFCEWIIRQKCSSVVSEKEVTRDEVREPKVSMVGCDGV